jgi:hypothetical protein
MVWAAWRTRSSTSAALSASRTSSSAACRAPPCVCPFASTIGLVSLTIARWPHCCAQLRRQGPAPTPRRGTPPSRWPTRRVARSNPVTSDMSTPRHRGRRAASRGLGQRCTHPDRCVALVLPPQLVAGDAERLGQPDQRQVLRMSRAGIHTVRLFANPASTPRRPRVNSRSPGRFAMRPASARVLGKASSGSVECTR